MKTARNNKLLVSDEDKLQVDWRRHSSGRNFPALAATTSCQTDRLPFAAAGKVPVALRPQEGFFILKSLPDKVDAKYFAGVPEAASLQVEGSRRWFEVREKAFCPEVAS